MEQPIDYSLRQTPQQAFMGGLQTGNALNELDQQRAAQEQAKLAQQQAMQAQQLMQRVLTNPAASFTDYNAVVAANPKFGTQIKEAWERKTSEQQQTSLGSAAKVHSALQSGRVDLAQQLVDEQIAAMENSGMDPAALKQAKSMRDMIQQSPDYARTLIGASIAAIPGGDKYFSSLKTGGEEQRAADLAAPTLALKRIEAINAPTKAALENQTAEEGIKSAQAKREIDALNVQIAQANSETSRGELILKRDDLIAKQGEKGKEGGAAAQDALDSANALIAQINGVKDHPGLDAGTGTLSGIRSFFKSSDGADFRKAVEGLKSPVFLNELGKLKAAGITLGQVTEVEGKKLEQRIANLDPDQSTPAFKNQVGVLLKDTEKFIAKITASGKLPTTGGAFVMKHPVYGSVNEGDINKLLTKFPGSTRDQVIQYLQSTGANKPQAGATGAY